MSLPFNSVFAGTVPCLLLGGDVNVGEFSFLSVTTPFLEFENKLISPFYDMFYFQLACILLLSASQLRLHKCV